MKVDVQQYVLCSVMLLGHSVILLIKLLNVLYFLVSRHVTYSSRNTVFEVSLESLGVGSLNGSDSVLLSQICFN